LPWKEEGTVRLTSEMAYYSVVDMIAFLLIYVCVIIITVLNSVDFSDGLSSLVFILYQRG